MTDPVRDALQTLVDLRNRQDNSPVGSPLLTWGDAWTAAEMALAVTPPPDRDQQAEQRAVDLVEAIRWTVEYVGYEALPAIRGWSWYDALRVHAPDIADDMLVGYHAHRLRDAARLLDGTGYPMAAPLADHLDSLASRIIERDRPASPEHEANVEEALQIAEAIRAEHAPASEPPADGPDPDPVCSMCAGDTTGGSPSDLCGGHRAEFDAWRAEHRLFRPTQ